MSVYTNVYDTATNAASNLRKQTTVAILVAATNILQEDPATAKYSQRLTWARRVLVDGAAQSEAQRIIWQVLRTAVIRNSPETSADNTIQAAVDALVDQFTGA